MPVLFTPEFHDTEKGLQVTHWLEYLTHSSDVVVVSDAPRTKALHAPRNSLIITDNPHPAYLDIIRAQHPIAVILTTQGINSVYKVMQIVQAGGKALDHLPLLSESFTPTERSILRYLILGHSPSEIVNLLKCTRITLNVHVSKLLEKLNYEDRTQLVSRVLLGVI
jgi:DNA-binding NarL/FixJ family response regulator